MAVVKMRKMSLLGLNSQKEAILKDIAFVGEVEFTDPAVTFASEEGLQTLVKKEEADSRISVLETKMATLKRAIDLLSPWAPAKKGLFAPKDSYTKDEFLQKAEDPSEEMEIATKALYLNEQIQGLNGVISSQTLQRDSLLPWKNYDLPLSFEGTKFTKTILYIAPPQFKQGEMEYALATLPAVVSVISGEEKGNAYCCAVVHKDAEADFCEALRRAGGTVVTLEGEKVSKEIELLSTRLAEHTANQEALSKTLKDLAQNTAKLQFCYDALGCQREILASKENLLSTGQTFLAVGYLPEEEEARLQNALAPYTVVLETSDPDPEKESVPVKLKNNSLVEPYEMVTEMYDLPQYGQLDPDAVMAPFFWLLAGMMFADLGYGIILTLVGLFLKFKLKIQGTFGRIAGLMWQCGISTMIFGALYGSFFGDAVTQGAKVFFGLDGVDLPRLLDPMKDPLTLMIVCIGVGLVHIMAGMGVQAYQLIKDGHPLDAVFDIGSWYLVFIGLVLLVLGVPFAKYVALAGVALIILTGGRAKKGIFGKLIGGFGALYGVTGYLSDLLSYSRILALSLSGAVVATVFNSIGSIMGHSVGGMVLFAVVFLIGHIFNIAMNLLSVYVHTSRLQYIEFFGKFYRSGGRPFAPVKVKPKYVDLKK